SVAGAGKEGVVVTEVDPKSAAAERGFKEGDVILEVAGKTVASPTDVRDAINAAKDDNKNVVLMRVKSGGQSRFVAVPLAEGWALRVEGVAGISRPRRRLFPGSGPQARSLELPSGGKRPPPSEGSRAVESPSFTARLFGPTQRRPVALHDKAGRVMLKEPRT